MQAESGNSVDRVEFPPRKRTNIDLIAMGHPFDAICQLFDRGIGCRCSPQAEHDSRLDTRLRCAFKALHTLVVLGIPDRGVEHGAPDGRVDRPAEAVPGRDLPVGEANFSAYRYFALRDADVEDPASNGVPIVIGERSAGGQGRYLGPLNTRIEQLMSVTGGLGEHQHGNLARTLAMTGVIDRN